MEKRKQFSTIIGNYLKDFRLTKGLTLMDIGEVIGCSAQAILNYENGKRIPTTDILSIYANTFNEDYNRLIKLRISTIIDTYEMLLEETPPYIKSEYDTIMFLKFNQLN